MPPLITLSAGGDSVGEEGAASMAFENNGKFL